MKKETILENKEGYSKEYDNNKKDERESKNHNIKNENKKETKDNKSNIIKRLDKRKIFNHINDKELVKTTLDNYGQDQKSVEYMKEYPPKMPDLFDHAYNLYNKDCLIKNRTINILDKGRIPNVFYNHLMVNINNKISKNKCKYISSSITQRNKKKLITFIYYSPKSYL
jgi:hypothetical protein